MTDSVIVIGSKIVEYAVTVRLEEKAYTRMSLSQRQFTPGQLTIVDLVDRILDKGVVITGDITISIVGVDLLSLKINLVIASLETAKRYGIKLPWEKWEKEQKRIPPKITPQKSVKR